ncbi:class I SAM-dependent methyltransferase [Actinomycetaceae bacterium TAE3-ERU4]|nr:class I SAM-dependent methyltransferase [Actinomycetaceae bacterium TAE3-ERU4]
MSFDERAKTWDTPRRFERASRIAKELRNEWEGMLPVENALEFGCGTGLITFALEDSAEQFYGYDISQPMLDIYTEKAKHLADTSPRKTSYQAISDLLQAPPLDLLFLSLVLHHLPSPQGFFKQVSPLLKPGGKITVVDILSGGDFFHSDTETTVYYQGFSPEDLEEAAKKEGLKLSSFRNALDEVKVNEDGKECHYSLFVATLTKPKFS